MQTILAGAVFDLDTAGAAFRSGHGSRAFAYGIKEGGAYLHADGILFLFETIAARDPATSGIGIADMHARQRAEQIEAGQAVSLGTQMAGGMIDELGRNRGTPQFFRADAVLPYPRNPAGKPAHPAG